MDTLAGRRLEIGDQAAASPLHTLIDLRWMRPGLAGGIENLSRSFLNQLLQLDCFNRYTVLVPTEVQYDFDTRRCSNFALVAADGPGVYVRRAVLSARGRYWRTPEVEALRRIHELRVDVALSIPGYIQPDLASLSNVEVMPDIQHEYHPEFFSPHALEERRRIYTASAQRAAHICAMSEFTRQTLIERLGIPPDRITTTHLAADPMFHSESSARRDHYRVLDKYGLRSGEYLLFPANTWRHKNHAVALEALRVLREAYGLDPLLVCPGTPKEAHGELLAKVKDARLESRVRFLGYCHPTYLPALYQGAAALVFPSLFEGFGMPLLEAMWCDCPVVCSNVTSLPEVAGDAALLVDPRSPEELAHAVNRVLTDTDLRRRLIERGRERVKRFSWGKFTREVVSVLHQVRPLRDRGCAEPRTEQWTRANCPEGGIGLIRSPLTPRRWQSRLSSVLFRFNRVGRAREHVRRMTESWARGEVLRSLPHAVAGAILAPKVAFSVGVYPFLRDRVYEKIVTHLEQRPGLPPGSYHDHTEPWGDGWVGPRLVLNRDTRHPAEFVALSGSSTLRYLRRRALTLTVFVDGKAVGRHRITRPGSFLARIALAGPLAPGRHTVEVEASAWWIPDRYLRDGEVRPLAWQMDQIELEPAADLERIEPWSDGWVGPRLVLNRDTRHPAEFVALSGWTNLRYVSRPLVLTVGVDGHVVGRHTMERSGRFVARIPVAGSLAPGRHTVEVEASAWWIPDRYLRNGDVRPLAWRLRQIQLEAAGAHAPRFLTRFLGRWLSR